jgi:cytochrome subunit of sulfide dehydrogenase
METNSSTRNVGKACSGTWLVTVVLLFGSTANGVQGAESAEITRNCNECHGTDGLGFKPGIPHINGQQEQLLTDMITSFQQGKRPTKVKMHRDIPAAEVAPLAKHYAGQKAQRPKSATKPELVAAGESLYLKRCADCHVDNGRDSDKEAPLLAAQDLSYLIAQTLAFKSGERKFPYLMDGAYKDLNDEDLTAIAHFFAAQDQVAPQAGRKRKR